MLTPLRIKYVPGSRQEKFAAYSLQHLQAYLQARQSGAPALIVADHGSSISALGEEFAYSHMGRPEEFDSFVLSFLYKVGPASRHTSTDETKSFTLNTHRTTSTDETTCDATMKEFVPSRD